MDFILIVNFRYLGGWHILSRQSIKKTISSFRAFEIENDDQSETLFEQNLQSAELVILYFHGQIGKTLQLFLFYKDYYDDNSNLYIQFRESW